jgi:hypothetical protein
MSEEAYRGLGWEHGSLVVQRYAAMLAPITFVLADGRQVSPMQVAPWAQEPGVADGVLKKLRGDWPCVPFGISPETKSGWPADWAATMKPREAWEEQHGYCSNHDWAWIETDGQSIHMAIDCPRDNPVKRVERKVTPDPKGPAVDLEVRVEVWEDIELPIGLHPTFRLPTIPGGARIEPGPFREGHTYPTVFEAGASRFALNVPFGDLAAVPTDMGSTIDATRIPFIEDSEDLLLLNGIDGTAALANLAEGYRVRMTWQPEHFPTLALWLTNKGRKMPPWNGRHQAIGMEPICSPYGLGPSTARADNPMKAAGTPTAFAFKAATPFVTKYRIAAEAL